MNYDPEAAERVRQVLSSRDGVVEKRMVGGLSFLVNGNMCCGITDRALMVRVGAKGREQALREPHVRPMQLGGRTLSGFVCVGPFPASLLMTRSLAGCSGDSTSCPGSQPSPSAPADRRRAQPDPAPDALPKMHSKARAETPSPRSAHHQRQMSAS